MTGPDYLSATGRKPRRGRPTMGPAPERADLEALYLREGLSIRETAAILGCSKEAVSRALRAAGITSRPKTRKISLSTSALAEISARVRRDGLRPTARALGLAPATVLRYFRLQSGTK